MADEDQYSRP